MVAGSVLVLLLLSPVFMTFRMTWGLWVGWGHEEGGSGQLQLHKLTARGLWLCSLPGQSWWAGLGCPCNPQASLWGLDSTSPGACADPRSPTEACCVQPCHQQLFPDSGWPALVGQVLDVLGGCVHT